MNSSNYNFWFTVIGLASFCLLDAALLRLAVRCAQVAVRPSFRQALGLQATLNGSVAVFGALTANTAGLFLDATGSILVGFGLCIPFAIGIKFLVYKLILSTTLWDTSKIMACKFFANLAFMIVFAFAFAAAFSEFGNV